MAAGRTHSQLLFNGRLSCFILSEQILLKSKFWSSLSCKARSSADCAALICVLSVLLLWLCPYRAFLSGDLRADVFM